jgi:hypothetical protein
MQAAHAPLPNLYDNGQYGYATIQFTMRGQRIAEHAGSMRGFAALVRTVPAEEFAVVALSNGEVPAVKTAEAAMEALLPVTVAVGAGNRPRLRFLVVPPAEGRPGYSHFALWAFRKVS